MDGRRLHSCGIANVTQYKLIGDYKPRYDYSECNVSVCVVSHESAAGSKQRAHGLEAAVAWHGTHFAEKLLFSSWLHQSGSSNSANCFSSKF